MFTGVINLVVSQRFNYFINFINFSESRKFGITIYCKDKPFSLWPDLCLFNIWPWAFSILNFLIDIFFLPQSQSFKKKHLEILIYPWTSSWIFAYRFLFIVHKSDMSPYNRRSQIDTLMPWHFKLLRFKAVMHKKIEEQGASLEWNMDDASLHASFIIIDFIKGI